MNVITDNQFYPPLSLASLQSSPQASSLITKVLTRPISEKPSTAVPQGHRGAGSKNVAWTQTGFYLPKKAKVRTVSKEQKMELALLKANISEDQFFKVFEGIKDIRVASETRLKQTLNEFVKLEQEPREKIKWNTLVKNGTYIGSRGQETKDIRVSGRALNKEKTFQNMRRVMQELKYEQKNDEKIIKHMTSRVALNPSLLLQPLVTQVTSLEAGTIPVKREPIVVPDFSRTNMAEVRRELVDLRLHTVDVPNMEESDPMLIHNKEQLKKIRESVSYLQRTLKNKKKNVANIESNRPDEEKTEETEKDEKDIELYTETPQLVGPNPSLRRVYSKRQGLEERVKQNDSKEEFIRRLGLSSARTENTEPRPNIFVTSEEQTTTTVSPSKSEGGFFMTETEVQSVTLRGPKDTTDQERNATSPGFYLPQKYSAFSHFRNGPTDLGKSEIGMNSADNIETFGLKLGKTQSSYTPNSFKHIKGLPSVNKPLGLIKNKSVYIIRTQGERKNSQFEVENPREAGKQEMQRKYQLLSIECDNARTSAAIQNKLERSFETIKGELSRMDEEIRSSDVEIKTLIKQDMYAEMQNVKSTLAMNLSKRTHSKSSKKDM